MEPPLRRGFFIHRETLMDIDTQRVRELLDKRDQIDTELAAIFSGTKKQVTCSKCGTAGHTARTCQKQD
jgi:hypothetical protein